MLSVGKSKSVFSILFPVGGKNPLNPASRSHKVVLDIPTTHVPGSNKWGSVIGRPLVCVCVKELKPAVSPRFCSIPYTPTNYLTTAKQASDIYGCVFLPLLSLKSQLISQPPGELKYCTLLHLSVIWHKPHQGMWTCSVFRFCLLQKVFVWHVSFLSSFQSISQRCKGVIHYLVASGGRERTAFPWQLSVSQSLFSCPTFKRNSSQDDIWTTILLCK